MQDNSFAKLIIQTAGSPVQEIVSLIIEGLACPVSHGNLITKQAHEINK